MFSFHSPLKASLTFLSSKSKPKISRHHHHYHWSGLQKWRDSPPNPNRQWGPTAPTPPLPTPPPPLPHPNPPSSLAEFGSLILSTPDPLTKSSLSHLAFSLWHTRQIPVGLARPPDNPARPDKPVLVSTKEVPAPKESGLPLNAYMLHSLAHVELNAVDLAWDTVVRFSPYRDELGDGFFSDFTRVADDESRHFGWCQQRLAELGFSYGDMPAHNLLWRECEKSSGNVAARLAVIPLVQEARGLDAGPRLVKKLIGFGDHRTSDIVAQIAAEEVAHVAVGVYWFVLVCQKMGRIPGATFKDLLKEYNVELKGPFNYTARDEAGIPRDWYDDSARCDETKSRLSEVHDRLACIIAMEKENSSLNN
ncbi:uncharacterized protein M6B38_126005 [Iris pallida]|uniref:DUF455 domain-containing protein n=1 Tax=Iris pallida TaxID=29817 RepID=A0AAX6GMU7_IRIPA|nr:uncharacterized protein M6B38_126005 [Iris pallida]